MFERVLLPAPFSPRSACTSPSSASKSTPSFATTPGNRFVIPRHAIAGRASTSRGATAPGSAVGSMGDRHPVGERSAPLPQTACEH